MCFLVRLSRQLLNIAKAVPILEVLLAAAVVAAVLPPGEVVGVVGQAG